MEIRFKSKKKLASPIALFIGVALIAAAIVIFRTHLPHIIALPTAAVAILCFVLAGELSIHGKYLLVMDDSGFLDSRLGIGKIDWADVDHVNLELNYGHRALSFRLRRSDLYLERLSSRRRAQLLGRRKLGFQRFTVDLREIDIDPMFLRSQILTMAKLHGEDKLPKISAPLSYV